MQSPQFLLGLADELIADEFACGGGMSEGIEQAIGRHVDIAVNHDADACSMHEANHPQTVHYCKDVKEVCPRVVTGDRAVGLLHLSPDCTHHSQARGGHQHRTGCIPSGLLQPAAGHGPGHVRRVLHPARAPHQARCGCTWYLAPHVLPDAGNISAERSRGRQDR